MYKYIHNYTTYLMAYFLVDLSLATCRLHLLSDHYTCTAVPVYFKNLKCQLG